jgi:NTP pyrophosphatase (non-canonical NTP hydrolase)
MENNFQKIIDRAIEIRKEYDKIEPKKWEANQIFMGLAKDIGDLSKILMVRGGFRNDFNGNNKKSLEHELADILLSIIWIAQKTGIDLEKSFYKAADEIYNRIRK